MPPETLTRISPEKRMLRCAFLVMRKWRDDENRKRYAAWCHEIALLLRAHGLAQVVAVIATKGDDCATGFISDFHAVVRAGLGRGNRPGPVGDLDAWRRGLCAGNVRMSTADYVVQSRLALRAADAMKGFAESVLNVDRASLDAVESDRQRQVAPNA